MSKGKFKKQETAMREGESKVRHSGALAILGARYLAICLAIVCPFLLLHGGVEADTVSKRGEISDLILTDPAMKKALKLVIQEHGAILEDERYQGSKILKITGANKDDVYGAWMQSFRPEPGKPYRLSLFSRTTKAFPQAATPVLMVFFFRDADCKDRIGVKYINLPKTPDWRLTSEAIPIPAGTDNLSIGFRLAGFVPSSEALCCARLEFMEIPSTGIRPITFEDWATRPRWEAWVTGPRARVRSTTIGTAEAHSGESYLEIEGADQSDQRDFGIRDIPVTPGTKYSLSFFVRMTPNLDPRRFVVMILQYDDARKGLVNAEYWYPFEHETRVTEWTRATHDIVTHRQAGILIIPFRLVNVLPGDRLFLDDLELRQGEPTVFLRWDIEPKEGVLSGSVKLSGDIADATRSVIVSITRENQVLKEHRLTKGQDRFSFDLNDLEDNVKYFVTAKAILADGREIRCKVSDKNNTFYTFTKDRHWEGHKLGILGKNDPPPAPWPPLSYNAATHAVTTWNKTITPGAGLGSVRVAFQEPALELNDIVLSLNGTPLSETFRFSPAKASHVSPNRIVLRSAGTGRDAEIQTSITVEFEGLIRHKVVLLPAKGRSFNLDKLTLTIRFSKDYVKYCYAKDGLTFARSWRSNEYYPAFWFGNYDTGILWCANRIYPSVRKQETDWICLDSKEEASVLSFNLVNKPMQIREEPLTVEFGLLPTPTRPFQMRARTVRFRSGEDATLNVCGTMPCKEITYFGYPEFTTMEEFKAYLAQGMMPRADMLFYFGTSYAMETIPQMTFFKKEWISVPSHSYTQEHPAYKGYATGDWTTVDMGNASWTDLCLFKLKPFMEQTGIKGVYNDSAYPHIREKDGECSCPVFEAQDFHRRMCVLVHQIAPDGWFISHQGLTTAMPWAAFSDFVMNGEHLHNQLKEHSYYLEFMSLPEIRAMLAAPLGPAHFFLSQYAQPEKRSNKALMAQVAGLAMLHDAQMWVAQVPWQQVLFQMMRYKYDFGNLTKATWYPYWDKNPYLESDNQSVICSFYERNGDLFLILFNTADRKQAATLKLRDSYIKKYPGRNRIVVYHPAQQKKEQRRIQGGRITVTLDRYQPKLLTMQE